MDGISAQLLGEPWALRSDYLARLVEHLSGNLAVVDQTPPDFARTSGNHGVAHRASVAVIPVLGMIEHRASVLGSLMGGTSLEEARTAFRAAIADPSVRAIVLDIDSPGGAVSGVPEFAAEIRAARGIRGRPIVAVANTQATSAGYWLASQADRMIATPSATVGGIGIYAVHQERSRALEAEGVTTTIISAGPNKVEANEWQPLSDDARGALQERAEHFYELFLSDVAKGRRVSVDRVRDAFGGGRPFVASQARGAGMVDDIAPFAAVLDEEVRRISSSAPARRRIGAAAYSVEADLEATAIGRHETDTAIGSWDGPANEARLPNEAAALRAANAWVDPDGDPDAKSSYRFIHHDVSADGSVGAANLTACSAGIAVLNGGRGGTTIPDADQAGVYEHLAGHLRDADREVPELQGATFGERLVEVVLELEELAAHAAERKRLRAKEGRPAFSTTTETLLRSTRSNLTALLDTDEPEEEDATTSLVADPPVPVTAMAPDAPPRRFSAPDAWAAYMQERGYLQ